MINKVENYILGFLLLILASEVFTLYSIQTQKPITLSGRVLSETEGAERAQPFTRNTPPETLSPSPRPTAQPVTRNTPPETLSPTPRPTAQPVTRNTPPAISSQEINGFIDRFSGQYGVDPNVIRHIAICESGFNPSAKKLSYSGLFQFGPTTWENLRIKMGEDENPDLRLNVEEAVQTAAYAVSIKDQSIWPHCYP